MSKNLISKLAKLQKEIRALVESGKIELTSYRYPEKKESDESKLAKLESRIRSNHKDSKMESAVVGLRKLQKIRMNRESEIKFPEIIPTTQNQDSYIPIGKFESKWFKNAPTSRIIPAKHSNRVVLSNMAIGNEQIRDMHRVNGNWFAYLQENHKPEILTLIQYRMMRDNIISQRIEIAREIETIYLSSAISMPVQESYTSVQTKGKGKGTIRKVNRIVYDSILSDSDNERVAKLYAQLGSLGAQLRGLSLRNPNRKPKIDFETYSGKIPYGLNWVQFQKLLKSRAKRLANKRNAEIAKILLERENRKLGLSIVAKERPQTIEQIQAVQKRVESRNSRLGKTESTESIENRYWAIQKLSSGEIVCHNTAYATGKIVESWLNVASAFKTLHCQNLIPKRNTNAQRKFTSFISDNATKGIAFTDKTGNKLAIILASEKPQTWPKNMVNLPKF